MRRLSTGVVAGLSASLLVTGMLQVPAAAVPPLDSDWRPARVNAPDNLPHPLGERQAAMREEALAALLNGEAQVQRRGRSEVIQLGHRRYVERTRSVREDPIFSILVEFGDQTLHGGDPGPRHNEIPRPDRRWDGNETDDNTTYWVSDFSPEHYERLFFGRRDSMREFYLEQSNGRYTVTGDVSDWVTVPYNEARYGNNDYESPNPNDPVDPDGGYWSFIRDTAQAWYEDQIARGRTVEEIREYLSQFDIWDRYDHDGDGNFDEPDGYIDHFQAIHAGEGEEAGGGAQGADAIWSHRWYAYSNGIGRWGPEGNLLGGVQIGDTGFWIGDYTTEPENGGLGVFAHEYAHDLGLPDLYDTAGGENGTGFWSLMSSGSWLGEGFDSIGTKPGYMGAWEKWVLGWLDYEVVPFGSRPERITLGPAPNETRNPQALIVTLPTQEITREWNTPYSGQYEWWSGSADDLNVSLSRTIDLTSATSSASITALAQYDIEEGYDYLYGEVSTNGRTWESVGPAIDGSTDGSWVSLSYDLSDYLGQEIQFRYRYQTDGGVHYAGVFLDDISLTVDGSTVWTDDVESGTGDWASNGWLRFTGVSEETAEHFYIAENRQYLEYDQGLRSGPYNFGWANTRPNWVEHFPYQNGLLIWYVNYAWENNNTSQHPGSGLVLPVDAHSAPLRWADGSLIRNRIQTFDSTFGLEATDAFNLHLNGTRIRVPSQPPVRVFDDSDPDRYWSEENPRASVRVAGAGVRIEVVSQAAGGDRLTVRVSFH